MEAKTKGKNAKNKKFRLTRQNYKLIKKIPVYKLVIHDQGKDKFRVIQQNRLTFQGSNEELECSQEDAIWNSIVGDQMDAAELIDFVDAYCKQQLNRYPSDANTLPYLIRKALLNHGYHLEGVVEYPAVW